MNQEMIGAISTIAVVIISRVISHFEHRKTEKGVKKNNTMLNEDTYYGKLPYG